MSTPLATEPRGINLIRYRGANRGRTHGFVPTDVCLVAIETWRNCRGRPVCLPAVWQILSCQSIYRGSPRPNTRVRPTGVCLVAIETWRNCRGRPACLPAVWQILSCQSIYRGSPRANTWVRSYRLRATCSLRLS